MFWKRSSKSGFSDLELIERYQNSLDQQYTAVLFDRYAHIIFGVCLKYLKSEEESKDLSMQVYEILIDKLATHQVEHFKSWLHTVVRNHCLMFLRKQKNIREKEDNIKYLYANDMEIDPFVHLENRQDNEIKGLEKALSELNEEQQLCVRLFYMEQKSYKDIALQTGIELKKVKSHIQNGKRNLKNILSRNDE